MRAAAEDRPGLAPAPIPRQPATGRALIVVNRRSRSGGEAELRPGLELLRDGGLSPELVELDDASRLGDVLRERGPGCARLVVGGGDGTISRSLPVLRELGRAFGILPLGTANDFARGLGLPEDPVAAMRIVRQGGCRAVDLGLANDIPFLNAAGVGLGPAMTEDLSDDEKSRWGVFAYLKAVLRARRAFSRFRARLILPGGRRSFRASQVTIANGRFYGGGMTAEQRATCHDGRLNAIVIRPVTLPQLLRLAPDLRAGRIRQNPELELVQASELELRTSRRLRVTTDGELTTRTPVRFRVLRHAIRVHVEVPS